MWTLGIAAACLGGIAAMWNAHRNTRRRFAAERDQYSRDLTSARAEAAQLRHGRAVLLAEALVLQAACAIVDNAWRSRGSQEQER